MIRETFYCDECSKECPEAEYKTYEGKCFSCFDYGFYNNLEMNVNEGCIYD